MWHSYFSLKLNPLQNHGLTNLQNHRLNDKSCLLTHGFAESRSLCFLKRAAKLCFPLVLRLMERGNAPHQTQEWRISLQKLCFLLVSEEAEREGIFAGFASHTLFLSMISAKPCFLSSARPSE